MNPFEAIPPKVRAALYLVYGIGSLVATYLAGKGVIGTDELTLWSGLGVLLGLTAASNTNVASKRGD